MATSLTYTKVAHESLGNALCEVVDIKADSAYPAGGYTLATADFETLLRPGATIGNMLSFVSEVNAAGYTCALDRTNSKLLFFLGNAQATTTVSTTTVRCRVYHGYVNHK